MFTDDVNKLSAVLCTRLTRRIGESAVRSYLHLYKWLLVYTNKRIFVWLNYYSSKLLTRFSCSLFLNMILTFPKKAWPPKGVVTINWSWALNPAFLETLCFCIHLTFCVYIKDRYSSLVEPEVWALALQEQLISQVKSQLSVIISWHAPLIKQLTSVELFHCRIRFHLITWSNSGNRPEVLLSCYWTLVMEFRSLSD